MNKLQWYWWWKKLHQKITDENKSKYDAIQRLVKLDQNLSLKRPVQFVQQIIHPGVWYTYNGTNG